MNGFVRPLHIALFLFITTLFIAAANCATFEVFNNCGDTVWAAAVPGGGQRLNHGESWTVTAPAGTKEARIWARTGCNFDGSGHGHCTTGDCNGQLICQGYGMAPNTLAEYSLNQYMNLDFFDISLIQGFNVPMDFSPVSGSCTRGIKCAADIIGQCPGPLKVQGGCSNPCTTDPNCDPNGYPKFYKNLCPDAYSYPKDDPTSTFTCPGGTNYKVTFCP